MATMQTPNGFSLDTAGHRVVVDPIPRIEGHLRIEANVGDDNVIHNAVSTGTMWRGIEVILKDRDPRDAWAFTQRICGVCTGVHALTSVRAVENTLGIEIPENANIIRNIMHLAGYTQDHLVHFYHLHALDWVDIVSALKADPKATSELAQAISPWPNSSVGYFRNVHGKLKAFVESGQIGPFSNAYWGHPAYKLPPEANLLAVAHYLEALDFQREIVKIQTVFGGKNPHPNWLVGGTPSPINLDSSGAVGAINMERINLCLSIADRALEFIRGVYIPDLLAVASFYKDWGAIGGGLAGKAMLSYGDVPRRANDYSAEMLDMPRGAIIDGDLSKVHEVNLMDRDQIHEFVTHSWFRYADESKGLHPFEGVTDINFALGPNSKGSKTNIEALDEDAKYSYLKAPRWRGHAMEVGPLARYVIGYVLGAQGNKQYEEEFKKPVDAVLKHLDVPVAALFSTLGRTAARGLECEWTAIKLKEYLQRLITNIKNGDTATANTRMWGPETWPKSASGCSFVEAPRGALGHWLTVENGKIANYQCVVPTTWNASPRDAAGNIGAYEASLLGTPMADPEQPLEILRTIHSFDPCLACASHVITPDGRTAAVATTRT